jgi:hypothetical protein
MMKKLMLQGVMKSSVGLSSVVNSFMGRVCFGVDLFIIPKGVLSLPSSKKATKALDKPQTNYASSL